MLNIARKLEVTTVEGPGKRSVLWLQGCLKRCPGCCNVGYLPLRQAFFQEENEIIAWLMENQKKHGIEGITLLGGEPVLQAKGILPIVQWCQENRLSVMLFTGYSEEELRELKIPYLQELLSRCDVIIAGPYLRERPEEKRNWVGSSNQKFIYNSHVYDSSIETTEIDAPTTEMILSQGVISIQGYPFLNISLRD